MNNRIKKDRGAWNLRQFFVRFPDNEAARLHMEQIRWNGEPFCPHCGSTQITSRKHKSMPYRCKNCRKEFSVRVGTIFANANVTCQQILLAIFLLSAEKKGVSSHRLAKEVECTQKTARYLEHRIRRAMKEGQVRL